MTIQEAEAALRRDPARVAPEVRAEIVRVHGESGYQRLAQDARGSMPVRVDGNVARFSVVNTGYGSFSTRVESAPATPAQAPTGANTDWKRELAESPYNMSAAARTAMDAELGVEKARRMRVEAGQSRAHQIKVTK
jgi:hypothetical protein